MSLTTGRTWGLHFCCALEGCIGGVHLRSSYESCISGLHWSAALENHIWGLKFSNLRPWLNPEILKKLIVGNFENWPWGQFQNNLKTGVCFQHILKTGVCFQHILKKKNTPPQPKGPTSPTRARARVPGPSPLGWGGGVFFQICWKQTPVFKRFWKQTPVFKLFWNCPQDKFSKWPIISFFKISGFRQGRKLLVEIEVAFEGFTRWLPLRDGAGDEERSVMQGDSVENRQPLAEVQENTSKSLHLNRHADPAK